MKKVWNKIINYSWRDWFFRKGPTKEWVEGWKAFMQQYAQENPYKAGTPEYDVWQSKYDVARREKS